MIFSGCSEIHFLVVRLTCVLFSQIFEELIICDLLYGLTQSPPGRQSKLFYVVILFNPVLEDSTEAVGSLATVIASNLVKSVLIDSQCGSNVWPLGC